MLTVAVRTLAELAAAQGYDLTAPCVRVEGRVCVLVFAVRQWCRYGPPSIATAGYRLGAVAVT